MLQVHGNHLARPQPALFDHFVRLAGHDARLRCQDQQSVRGKCVASGAQPITVERRADKTAITKGECCRAIPWFDLAGMVLAPGTLDTIEFRSEERRVGKECRSRWSPYH